MMFDFLCFYGSVHKHQHTMQVIMRRHDFFVSENPIDKSVFSHLAREEPKKRKKNCVEQTASSAVKGKVIMRTKKKKQHTPSQPGLKNEENKERQDDSKRRK